jgi:hypothetical protein
MLKQRCVVHDHVVYYGLLTDIDGLQCHWPETTTSQHLSLPRAASEELARDSFSDSNNSSPQDNDVENEEEMPSPESDTWELQ